MYLRELFSPFVPQAWGPVKQYANEAPEGVGDAHLSSHYLGGGDRRVRSLKAILGCAELEAD